MLIYYYKLDTGRLLKGMMSDQILHLCNLCHCKYANMQYYTSIGVKRQADWTDRFIWVS